MILHDPKDMRDLALTGLDNDVRKTLMWAAGRLTDLDGVVKAAQSVLSEDGVKEYLSAYVMGVELIDRLAALESE